MREALAARAIELRAERVIEAEFTLPQARAAFARIEELPAEMVVRASTGPAPR